MGKYKELAADIVAHVGGKENVTGLRHCFTRLRFNLADDKKADTAYLKNRDGVISVVNSGGEYMVVIGEHVHDVYLDVCEVLGVDAGDSGQVKNSDASADAGSQHRYGGYGSTDEFDVRCGHYQRHFVDCRSMRVAIR